MGVTAENVAREHAVSREDQDAWAFASQQRAADAVARHAFDTQLQPVNVVGRKGAITTIADDEHPRPETDLDSLANLRPAFAKDGTVTAGNASGINDGAAAVVLMREDDASAQGREPLARLVDWSRAALEPSLMGFAPTLAVERLLDRTHLAIEDLDVIELNEAFAAQVLAVMRATGMSDEQVNPNGGAIAFGHPVGATGAILTASSCTTSGLDDLQAGMVTMCIGGGQALAAIFERI